MPRRDLKIFLLAVAGAGVDAMMIMGFNVLTAAQTGNTILLSVALARGDFVTLLSSGISVLGFVLGAGLGEWLLWSFERKRSGGPRIWRVLFIQTAVLGAILIAWGAGTHERSSVLANLLVGGAALCMGIQSIAALRLNSLPTTYVTGMLASFTTSMTKRWFARCEEDPASQAGRGAINGWTWLVYALGAIATACLYRWCGELALLAPMLMLGVVVVMDALEEKFTPNQ